MRALGQLLLRQLDAAGHVGYLALLPGPFLGRRWAPDPVRRLVVRPLHQLLELGIFRLLRLAIPLALGLLQSIRGDPLALRSATSMGMVVGISLPIVTPRPARHNLPRGRRGHGGARPLEALPLLLERRLVEGVVVHRRPDVAAGLRLGAAVGIGGRRSLDGRVQDRLERVVHEELVAAAPGAAAGAAGGLVQSQCRAAARRTGGGRVLSHPAGLGPHGGRHGGHGSRVEAEDGRRSRSRSRC